MWPRTKRILSTSLHSPTLRFQTPSKVHACCPEPGHWGSGDRGGKIGPAPPPWDLKPLSELKKNPIVTAASPSRQPNPEYRAELEKEVARPLCRSEPPLKCSGLAARCGLSAKSLPAFQMLAARQKVTSGLCQDFFPEELAGSSKHGSDPRAASGSNGTFLPSQSELGRGEFCFYSPSPGGKGGIWIKENQTRKKIKTLRESLSRFHTKGYL